MSHRTAAERRKARRVERSRSQRRPGSPPPGGWDFGMVVASGPPTGPDVRSASLDEVLASLDELGPDLEWQDLAPRIVPLFDRVRPFPPGFPEHTLVTVPPGIPIRLGIDIGPAFAYVTPEMVDRWSLSSADVAACALANLHARATEVQPAEVVWGDIDGVLTGWLQTDLGIASTLVLAPDELGRIVGTEPRLLVAPMRDLLIALPPDEPKLATWLFSEVASQDPNHLHPRLFEFDGRGVTVRAMG